MVRSTKTNVITAKPVDDDELEQYEMPDSGSYDEEALKKLYNEIAGNADAKYEFSVKKVRKGLRGYGHCFNYNMSDYTFAQIIEKTQDEFGPGEYKLQVRNEKGHLKLNQTFFIEENLKISQLKTQPHNDTLVRLSEQSNAILERMEKMHEKKNGINWDVVLPAMIAGAPALVVAIQGMIPKRQELNPIKIMRLMHDIQTDLSQSDNKSESMLAAINKAMEVFGKPIMESAKSEEKQKMIALENEVKYLRNTLDATKQNELEVKNQSVDDNNRLKVLLSMAIKGAKKEADPLTYALLISDQLDVDEFDSFYQFLKVYSGDALFSQLAAFEPEVLQHREWLEKLIEAYKNLFEEEEEQT